jgi:antitoxin component of MazEF toxin-antitoxin module
VIERQTVTATATRTITITIKQPGEALGRWGGMSKLPPLDARPPGEAEALDVSTEGSQAIGMPSPRVRAVIELLDEMNEEERKELRTELESERTPSEWKRAWNDDLARRIAQIEANELELVDGDEVLADLRRDMAT